MDNSFQDALSKGLISVRKPQFIRTCIIRDMGFWMLLDNHPASPGMLDDTMYYTAESVRYEN